MSYFLSFSEKAQNEIIETIQWYNGEKEKLGFEFYERLKQKVTQISSGPHHYSLRFNNIRAAKVDKYPYLIYFKIIPKNSSIIVLGVLHTSRNPKTIKKQK